MAVTQATTVSDELVAAFADILGQDEIEEGLQLGAGVEAETAYAPVNPPAPARFSTMKGWFSFLERIPHSMRVNVSLLAPGPNGTTKVTGRFGHSAACAVADLLVNIAAPAPTRPSGWRRSISTEARQLSGSALASRQS